MHVEVSVALNFIFSYLYNKLPRRRVDMLCEELERGLRKKFEGHWYPDEPCKGSGFRCIRLSGEKIEPALDVAVTLSGLSMDEIQEYLPKGLTIWIDPSEVSYRIGENGSVGILYRNHPHQHGLQHHHHHHRLHREQDRSSSSDAAVDKEVQSVSDLDPAAGANEQPTQQQQPRRPSSFGYASPLSNGSWGGRSPVGGPQSAAAAGSLSPSSATDAVSGAASPLQPGAGGLFLSTRPSASATTSFTAATFAQT